MIPRPNDAAGGDDAPGAGDLAVGVARTTWPWIVGAVALFGFVGFLLWGANRPDDPVLPPPTPEQSAGTPADGLQFAEVARLIGESCLKLLVADTPEERASGLRYRESELDRVDGMLFVHDSPQQQAGFFTMSGVVEPLEVGFYGPDGKRTGGHDMEPCSASIEECQPYEAPGGWQFAIETAPGKLPPGDLGGECAAPS